MTQMQAKTGTAMDLGSSAFGIKADGTSLQDLIPPLHKQLSASKTQLRDPKASPSGQQQPFTAPSQQTWLQLGESSPRPQASEGFSAQAYSSLPQYPAAAV